MNRLKPKTYVVPGKQMFAYYSVHEMNEYLKEKDAEILALKRANEALRLQVLRP